MCQVNNSKLPSGYVSQSYITSNGEFGSCLRMNICSPSLYPSFIVSGVRIVSLSATLLKVERDLAILK